jgi:hypothetical protein
MAEIGNRCHLLHLPNETLHAICKILYEDANEYEEAETTHDLANLRLVCRGLQYIPEEYLFQSLLLDQFNPSVENLTSISNHPRLRTYVTDIYASIPPLIDEMTYDEWTAQVAAYGTRDLWPGNMIGNNGVAYDRLLVQHRDSLSDAHRDLCWRLLEQRLKKQRDAMRPSVAEHIATLRPMFANLPALKDFTFCAWTNSFRINEDCKAALSLLHRVTILPPRFFPWEVPPKSGGTRRCAEVYDGLLSVNAVL